MHPLRSLDLVGRYSLAGALRDPITMTAVALGATAAGTAVSAGGSLIGGSMKASAEEQMGQLAQRGAEFQAQQLDQAATESRAASQRQAFEKQRLGRLALSSLTARAASSGGSATDTDAVKIAGDIAGRSEYEALGDLYTGENRARGLTDEATGARYTGAAKAYGAQLGAQATRAGSYFDATGTILKGVGSFGKDYAKGYG